MNFFNCCSSRMGKGGADLPAAKDFSSPSPLDKTIGPGEVSPGGTQCGLGIAFKPDKSGKLYVKRLIVGGPAEMCNEILVGDLLQAVDGKNVAGMNRNDVANLLMGPEGSKARLRFLRMKQGGSGGSIFVDCVVERRPFDGLA